MKAMEEEAGFIRHGDRRLLMTMLHRHRLAANPTRQGCPARDYNSDRGESLILSPDLLVVQTISGLWHTRATIHYAHESSERT
jgi:hypothetical protein